MGSFPYEAPASEAGVASFIYRKPGYNYILKKTRHFCFWFVLQLVLS